MVQNPDLFDDKTFITKTFYSYSKPQLRIFISFYLGFLDGSVFHGDHFSLPVFSRLQRHPRPHFSGLETIHNQLRNGSHKLKVTFRKTKNIKYYAARCSMLMLYLKHSTLVIILLVGLQS